MWVIKGAVADMPYWAGKTQAPNSTIYHWASAKRSARHYKSWVAARLIADNLVRDGITAYATVEKV